MSNLKSAAPQTNDADYNNPNVKVSLNFISYNLHYQSKRQELGDFKYENEASENYLGKREFRKATILENGANYEGEWLLKSQTRQGRGT